MGQVDLLQGLLHPRFILRPAGRRVGNDGAQIAQRQVRPLRQEQRLVAKRAPDLTLGIRPEACQRTQQRGFATARRPLDQQRLAGVQVKVQVGDKGMPVRAQHLQAADR